VSRGGQLARSPQCPYAAHLRPTREKSEPDEGENEDREKDDSDENVGHHSG